VGPHVSRRDLYALVWSEPVLKLAEQFGVSDVAVAKACRRYEIPLPGRGHWARIAAGEKIPKTPNTVGMLEPCADGVGIHVSPDQLTRAIGVMDALIKALIDRGCTIELLKEKPTEKLRGSRIV
jgi:hypothetical protein